MMHNSIPGPTAQQVMKRCLKSAGNIGELPEPHKDSCTQGSVVLRLPWYGESGGFLGTKLWGRGSREEGLCLTPVVFWTLGFHVI